MFTQPYAKLKEQYTKLKELHTKMLECHVNYVNYPLTKTWKKNIASKNRQTHKINSSSNMRYLIYDSDIHLRKLMKE